MRYPSALFDYAFNLTTVYTHSTVGLMLVVANSAGHDVTCAQIGFALTPGREAADLTEDVATIAVGVVQGTHWTPAGDTPGIFAWTPDPGHEVLHDGESIAFVLTGIAVNDVPGLVPVTVYETTDEPRQARLALVKSEAALGITSFTAVPVQVNPGQRTTLTWTTIGADHCTLSTDASSRAVDPKATRKETPAATTTYTLTAEGQGTSQTAQIIVTVPEVRVLDFRAEPSDVAQGDTVTLSWTTLGATTATIRPGRGVLTHPARGELALVVERDTRFSLRATSARRSASQDCDVTVWPTQIASFAAAPEVLAPGDSATLTWATQWTRDCTIEPAVGPVDTQGSVAVRPTSSTTYRLRAAGLEPKDAMATVGVGAAITSLGIGTGPTAPDHVDVDWNVVADTVTVTVTDAAGSRTAPVPPVASRSVRLAGGQVTTVSLHAELGGTRADAAVSFAGPLSGTEGRLDTLRLECAPGINTPYATCAVHWVVALGDAWGWMTNGQGDRVDVTGGTGVVRLGLGQRAPGSALWRGHVEVGDAVKVGWQVG